MQTRAVTSPRTNINIDIIYNMRQSGATLQRIGDEVGITKERVRQILVKNRGSTKHELISSEQLSRVLGLPRNQGIELYEDSVITPVAEWNRGNRHYLLFSPTTAEQIISYYKSHRLCKICRRPIPRGRRVYCSEQCYKEGHKYRYKSIEAKQRHIRSIKRYTERRKQWVIRNINNPIVAHNASTEVTNACVSI